MDSAGVIPELNGTLPPVPHFTFTAIASPGGVQAPTRRAPLHQLLVAGPNKLNLDPVSMSNS